MRIRHADLTHCDHIARLSMMAGDGIPGFFWEYEKRAGEDLYATGARLLTAEDKNFSYRNATIAELDDDVAGMMLAYRLTEEEDDGSDLPEFIIPFIELEELVLGSFYINMIAAYPEFRGRGIGSRLMREAEHLAADAGCDRLSLQVFDENEGAHKLYLRLGYEQIARRDVIPHECYPHKGRVLLMVKPV